MSKLKSHIRYIFKSGEEVTSFTLFESQEHALAHCRGLFRTNQNLISKINIIYINSKEIFNSKYSVEDNLNLLGFTDHEISLFLGLNKPLVVMGNF